LSVSTTTNVTRSPTFGLGLLTSFETARSALCTLRPTDALLLPVFESGWSEWVIVAVFDNGFGEATVAWIVSVCGVPVVTVPIVQRPVVAS
jgi:hypothetical protein